MRKFALLLTCLLVCGLHVVFAQSRTITGKVTDADDGKSLPGVSVVVKGTTIGTITDADGKYSINVPQSSEALTFSFVGMKKREQNIDNRTEINVTLAVDDIAMDEFLVVAYGTAKKEAFTGSAASVKSEDLAKRQVSNVTQAISGKVAGVQVVNSNGQPGTSATIRIRGVGSMSASNSPLYVVDGVPYDGSISAINPNDIESMSVLKDAAASAIYGARGGNGVVIITTKKGKSKEAEITLDAKWGNNSRAVPSYEVMNDPAMYYETFYKSLYNSKIYNGSSQADATAFARSALLNKDNGGLGYQVYTVPDGQYLIGSNGKLNPNATLGYSDGDYYYTPDDWYDILFDRGNVRQEYNVSISGASEKMTYYMSAGYLDDSGIVDGSGFSRYTSRASVDYQAKKWLKVGANVGYTNYNIQSPSAQTSWGSSGNLFYVTNMIAPIYPMYVRNTDGSIRVDDRGITVYDFGNNTNQTRAFMSMSNPAIDLQLDKHNAYTDVLNTKWFAILDIIEGLQLTANISANVANQRESHLYNQYYGTSVSSEGAVSVESARDIALTQQYLANYKKSFGYNNIDILAGYESYSETMQDLYVDNRKMYNPEIAEIGNSIFTPANVDSYTDKYSTLGFLARAQYDYDERIYVSGSYRRDASSRFHKDNRWGNFGSAGAAWIISKENFFMDLNAFWINMLKVKASYGIQGNDNLLYSSGYSNYYPYLDQYTVSNSDGEFSTSLSYKGNKDITWETSYNFNAGIEFELFNNRLEGSAEYFSRKTVDLLYYQPVPASLGYSSLPMNVGSIVNRGYEVDLTGTIIDMPDFRWQINANITGYKNEILDLAESVKEQGIKGTMSIMKIGGSVYDSYLREYAGVDKETGKALYYKVTDGEYVLDADGNKTTTDSWSATSQIDQGNTMPKVYGGFGTTLDFYGFDLSVDFSYQLGGRIYDFTYEELMHNGDNAGLNWHKDILNAWTPENTNSDVPRLSVSDDSYQLFSTRFLVSSNYLSLNNVTFGYTLPKKLTDKAKIGSLRVYVAGENLGMLTARRGLDPRQMLGATSYTGAGAHRYSAIRTITGGLTLKF